MKDNDHLIFMSDLEKYLKKFKFDKEKFENTYKLYLFEIL